MSEYVIHCRRFKMKNGKSQSAELQVRIIHKAADVQWTPSNLVKERNLKGCIYCYQPDFLEVLA